jgi:hypothetical protein
MFTPSQYNRFKDHPNLIWLRYQASKNYAVQQDIIKAKISEAIKSAFPDRVTDENIRWVAQQVGTPWGNVVTPVAFTEGSAYREAVAEIEGTSAVMAQAVKMVFNRTAAGRTAPVTTNINHIHVGGNAQLNLLFDSLTATVLGVVNGHMDSTMSPTVSAAAARVARRRGGTTVRVRVTGSEVKAV